MYAGSEIYDWGSPDGLHGHLIIDDYAQHSSVGMLDNCIVGDLQGVTFDIPGSQTTTVSSSGWFASHSWELLMLAGAIAGYTLLVINAKIAGATARMVR